MAAQGPALLPVANCATGRTQSTLEVLADDYEQRQKAAEEEASPGRTVMRLGPANDLPE
jgi:hypothetical protein